MNYLTKISFTTVRLGLVHTNINITNTIVVVMLKNKDVHACKV